MMEKHPETASRHPASKIPLLPAERRQRILKTIRADTAIRAVTLSKALGVSTMTIRRDLDLLEKKGLVERAHGGAVLRRVRTLGEFRYQASAQKNRRQKGRIARRAAAMIEPGDIVFVAEGATSALVLRYIDPSLTFRVFSNNVAAISEMSGKAAELVLLGGIFQPDSMALSGPTTLETIAQVHATKTFLSADGLSISSGVTTQNHEIAAVDRQMIRQTRGRVILMADSTKIELVGEYVISPAARIDTLVTDAKISTRFKKDIQSLGVRVVIA